MSTLTTKFSLGQWVWKVYPSTEDIEVPCRLCRGRGWLHAKGANNESCSVKCPSCGVNATVRLGTWPEWRVVSEPLQIAMIRLEVFDRTGDDNGERADNRNPARVSCTHGVEDRESYMAWSTGVGSGTLHSVEDLFASCEEAEEEATQRTKRARAGEDPGGRNTRPWWPTAEQVRGAQGFLDHRDVYEHNAAHVALAQVIIEVAAKGHTP
jgi:hypothetical protein